MSSGRKHTSATLKLIPINLVVSGVLTTALEKNYIIVGGVVVGSLASIIINPDLDQEGFSHVEWKLMKNVVGIPHLVLWYPYALSMWHRELWSHFPIIGTFIRTVYIALIAIVTHLAITTDVRSLVKIAIITFLYIALSQRTLFFTIIAIMSIASIILFVGLDARWQQFIAGVFIALSISVPPS